jgi:hypothetical protein
VRWKVCLNCLERATFGIIGRMWEYIIEKDLIKIGWYEVKRIGLG